MSVIATCLKIDDIPVYKFANKSGDIMKMPLFNSEIMMFFINKS